MISVTRRCEECMLHLAWFKVTVSIIDQRSYAVWMT